MEYSGHEETYDVYNTYEVPMYHFLDESPGCISDATPSSMMPHGPQVDNSIFNSLAYDTIFFAYESPTTSDYQTTPSDAPSSISPAELHEFPSHQLEEISSYIEDQYKVTKSQPKRSRDRKNIKLQLTAIDSTRLHACTMCIRRFKRRSDLLRHVKRHQGIQDYPCSAPGCPLPAGERSFFRADARQRHWKRYPRCEQEFYQTQEGIEWARRNRNRSQRARVAYEHSPQDSSPENTFYDHDEDDSSDADYCE